MVPLARASSDAPLQTQLVTTPVYAAMKREIKARHDGGWARVDWALPTRPQLRDLEVVHGRMVYLNPKVFAKEVKVLAVVPVALPLYEKDCSHRVKALHAFSVLCSGALMLMCQLCCFNHVCCGVMHLPYVADVLLEVRRMTPVHLPSSRCAL